MRNIGKNIRLARIKRNMKQEELAEKLFVTRQTVSNYENGKSKPDVDMLDSIAKVLDVEINDLLDGSAVEHGERKEQVKLIVWTAVLAVLVAVSAVLMPNFKQIAATTYHMFPIFLLRFMVIPALFALGGWVVMQVLHVFFGLKKPLLAARKALFLSLLILTVLVALLIAISITLPTLFEIQIPFLMNKYVTRLCSFIGKHPYALFALGAALWLTSKK